MYIVARLRGQRFGPMEIRMYITSGTYEVLSKRVTISGLGQKIIGLIRGMALLPNPIASQADLYLRSDSTLVMMTIHKMFEMYSYTLVTGRGHIGARLERGPDSRINNPSINVPGKTVKIEGVGATIPA